MYMFKNHKRLATALTVAMLMSVSAGFAKAPDFTVQIPYKGKGIPTPQQDYYLYMNANWLKNTKIAPDESTNSYLTIANAQTNKNLSEITKQSINHQKDGIATLDEKNIANMYACIQDQKGRNEAGLGNLAPILKRIEKINNLQEYAETMADMSQHNIIANPLLGGYHIINDPISNDHYVISLNTPATFSREMMENKENDALWGKYRNCVRDMLHLYGRNTDIAVQTAIKIFNLQKDLSLHSQTVAESADPSKTTNKMTLADLQKLYSHVNVTAMLDAGNIGPKAGIQNWYVSDPGLTSRLNELYTPEQLPLLKEYAIFAVLASHSTYLSQDYQNLISAFEKNSSGAMKERSPEKRDLLLNEELLPFTYGRLYAKTYFDETRKNLVKSYVHQILNTYKNRLQRLDWMTQATKNMALKKLDTIDINIGYPEAWQEYIDHLDIKSPKEGGILINNVLTMDEQIARWNRARVGASVRKDLWENLTPQTINASYEPTDNSINFPAGILQAPFFDTKATNEANLGSIGIGIAHEITHCFDNYGAQYDELGRQHNWWEPSDYAEFKIRQEKVIAYYSRYLLPNGTRMKGEQTLSEDIADLGALSCITEIIGHHPEKLRQAYQSYGRLWRNKSTNQKLQALLANIHSLSYIRADAVLSTTDGFYEAYHVVPGDPMYVAPEDRVRIW